MSKGVVLVADDDKTLRYVMSHALRNDGYTVLEARTGAEALDVLGVSDVDVVLLDDMMPELSGKETLERLSKLTEPPAVIMVTASLEHENECLRLGARDYLRKPLRLETLLLKVNNHALVRRDAQRRHAEGVRQMGVALCHNVNQPLTVLCGYVDMLLNDKTLTGPHREKVGRLKEANKRLVEIIGQIRTLLKGGEVSVVPYLDDKMVDIKRGSKEAV